MKARNVFAVAALGFVLLLGGCGGGGGGDGVVFYSASFSPIRATTPEGGTGTLRWVYRINGGQPLTMNENGVTLTMNCSDLELTINPSTLQRTAVFSMSLGGDASGSADAVFEEALVADPTRTLVQNQNMSIDMRLSAQGQSASISIDMLAVPSAPVEWFLDREDLDTLGIGYVHADRGVAATVSGSVSVSGYGSTSIPATSAQYDEVWTIVGMESSVNVGGREYQNVVKVQRETYVPDPSLSGGAPQRTTIEYWVAKGVGMIRGVNMYRMFGQDMTVELVDTNLGQ